MQPPFYGNQMPMFNSVFRQIPRQFPSNVTLGPSQFTPYENQQMAIPRICSDSLPKISQLDIGKFDTTALG
jgi:hypothetical protein